MLNPEEPGLDPLLGPRRGGRLGEASWRRHAGL
jgi:hypothetical protein